MSANSTLSQQRRLNRLPVDLLQGKTVALTATGNHSLLDEIITTLVPTAQKLILFCHDDEQTIFTQNHPSITLVPSARSGLYGMKVTSRVLNRLWHLKPDAVIVLYRNLDGARHKRAELLAFLSSAQMLFGVNKAGVWFKLSRRFLVWQAAEPIVKLMYKPIRSMGYTVAMLAYLLYRGHRTSRV